MGTTPPPRPRPDGSDLVEMRRDIRRYRIATLCLLSFGAVALLTLAALVVERWAHR